MLEDIARMRFFIPKPFVKHGKHTDKYPYVVMENIAEETNTIHGKFPDEKNAQLFLELLRRLYVEKLKTEFTQAIEAEVAAKVS